jgi:hypothetical protein
VELLQRYETHRRRDEHMWSPNSASILCTLHNYRTSIHIPHENVSIYDSQSWHIFVKEKSMQSQYLSLVHWRNNLAQAVKHVTYIREVPGSNLGQEIGETEWGFLWSSSDLHLKLTNDSSFRIFSYFIFSNNSNIQRRYVLSYWHAR